MSAERLAELGLYDPGAPDAADRLRLLEHVLALGATEEELVGWGDRRLGAFALEVAMRGSKATVPFADAAAQAGLSLDEAAALWRALGFPDPRTAEPRLPADTVEVLKVLAGLGHDLLGPESMLAVTRVVGSTSARLAQALVDAFRAEVEMPMLAAGTPYADVVERFTRIASEDLPAAFGALALITRQHLVAHAAGSWSAVDDESVARRELVIGFADLVGYTSVSRSLSGTALASLIRRFESLLGETVLSGGGRVAKLIGDGAMFACDDGAAACGIGLELCSAFGGELPEVRVGLAAGSVVALEGDYYGEAVNVAARLVARAEPSTVAADEHVRARTEGFAFERLPEQALKGLPAMPAYRVGASFR